MGLPISLTRRLVGVAVAAAQRRANMGHTALVAGVKDGSSYCALALAKRIRASSVDDLVLEIGGLPEGRKDEVFNALADGYSVFTDARGRGLL